MIKKITGDFQSVMTIQPKIAIVTAHFNELSTKGLLEGAIDTFSKFGCMSEHIRCYEVPGAFELPLACQRLAQRGGLDGIVALGAVIRGATSHFDYVAGPCSSALMNLQVQYSLPISFGVLTTDTLEQALERSGSKAGNKGAEAAMVLLQMIDLMRKIDV